MIRARFSKRNHFFIGFSLSGHAGYDDFGHDICCAAVSSAVQTICNGITDVFGKEAAVEVTTDKISLKAAEDCVISGLIETLLLQIQCLAEDFPKRIHIDISEV